MFTGIVEEIGRVISVQYGQLTIEAGAVLQGLDIGGSISVNGVCLTVTKFSAKSFFVDVMAETLKRSNLEFLSSGDNVNLERPLILGGPLGGHLVQGHVDATGKLSSVRIDGKASLISFEAPDEVMRYVVDKGFIAVDGISLTVVSRDSNSFQVSVVEHTRRNTTLADRRVGSPVNLEVDIIAKYVEQLGQVQQGGITASFLQENGFLVS
ncbi:MAG: riboflavin synthase [Dehalococcoidales bacterium]|nr:riboflavin synthase [Dehalococcoidales bacterium]